MMEYTRLGTSGLKVSRIALGCMSFSAVGRQGAWALERRPPSRSFDRPSNWASPSGTATSTGWFQRGDHRAAITKFTKREDVVIATVVRPHGPARGRGLSRRAALEQVDASLKRLGTDYTTCTRSTASIRTPRSRDNGGTPQRGEGRQGALHRRLSMWAWQFSKMQYTAELHN